MWPKVSLSSVGLARKTKPQHVHRRAVIVADEAGLVAHGRMPAVAADGERGADRQRAVRRLGAQPDDAAAFLDQVGGFGIHVQMEAFVALALLSEEIEKVPLRHQRHEFAVRRQMGEIGHRHALGADLGADPFDLLVRHFEELHRAGRARTSVRASTDVRCRRENREKSPDIFPAPRHRRRRAPAESRASCRPVRRRRCSMSW